MKQTVNQLLVELDGFEENDGLIVVGATNFPDSLDPALIRPGRFDRTVNVPLPTRSTRRAIAHVHSRGIPLAEAIDLDDIALKTSGMSGAEIENVFNEAAIEAARANQTVVAQTHIDLALDRVTFGLEAAEEPSYRMRHLVAVHEAGHAIVANFVKAFRDPVRKVTIQPRASGVGGYTLFDDDSDTLPTKEYLAARLAVVLGGRAAEEEVFGREKATVGAASDWANAKRLARQLVVDFRFYDGDEDDEERIEAVIEEALFEARNVVQRHREALDTVVALLLEKTAIDGEEFARAIA